MPTEYGRTGAYQRLRVCERFGQEPGWIERQTVGMTALLLGYEEVREQEEARDAERSQSQQI